MTEPPAPSRMSKTSLCLLGLILLIGMTIRVYPSASYKNVGFDEHMYATYASAAAKLGLTNYNRVVDDYLSSQAKRPDAIVPATRIGFIWPAALISEITGCTGLRALYMLSVLAAISLLMVTAVIGYRLGTVRQTLIATALMATAPLQLFLGQRALVDEYFALWAVLCAWFFFEAVRNQNSVGWVLAFAGSLFLLVLTKENAAFVLAALSATWICFGLAGIIKPDYRVLIAAVAAGAAAVLVLCYYVGGVGQWITFYRNYGAKSAAIDYVIRFQDGPWYRYLVDFTVLSPLIVALVFGRIFNLGKESAIDLFWAVFLGFSLVFMSSIRLGMSLRFAAYWDEPLRWLAASQLGIWATRFSPRWRKSIVLAMVLLLAAIDLGQYYRFFVKTDIYDPVSVHLLRASKLVK